MAIGFGSTYGTGSTDNITLTVSNAGTQRTIAIYCMAASTGGGAGGRAFDAGGFLLLKTATALRLQRSYATTGGTWEVPLSNNEVANFVFTFDWSSAANDPRCWKNGTEVAVTETQTPSGAAGSFNSAFYIGNRSDLIRNWDGWITRLAFWTSILPDTACASISKGFSPLKYSPSTLDFYLPMLKVGRDVSRNNRTITVTGTAFQTHPRVLGGYR